MINLSRRESLRVLMYHKISADGTKDFLTVPLTELERQFQVLRQEGYTPILLSELANCFVHKKPLPFKAVMLTFDDGYRDNYINMYPLLKKYGMKANIFLVPFFLHDDRINESPSRAGYLRISDIQSMDPGFVEFGLHSYDHMSYKNLSSEELHADIIKSKEMFQRLGVNFQPCLAFPYGAYPGRLKRRKFFETLRLNNIILAFRIGNRLNPLPLRNPLLIQRLDIRGNMSLDVFIKRLYKGKGIV